jgi:hypothetical protein
VSWARFDDGMTYNAKVIKAGNAATGAWARMICWSCAQGTDGRVPRHVALNIAKPAVLKHAVAAGLLHEVDDGYTIHDFLDWNPDANTVLERRKQRAAAGARGGHTKSSKRLANARAPTLANTTGLANQVANQVAKQTGNEKLSEVLSKILPRLPSPVLTNKTCDLMSDPALPRTGSDS